MGAGTRGLPGFLGGPHILVFREAEGLNVGGAKGHASVPGPGRTPCARSHRDAPAPLTPARPPASVSPGSIALRTMRLRRQGLQRCAA